MRAGRALAIALLSGVLCSTLAHADPSPGEIQAARELFAKAEQDEDAGNWAAALDKLRRAASVKITPGIRYHIGLCEEKLGQIAAALNDYSGAESLAREQKNKEVLEIVAEPIRALKARVPTLLVDATAVDGLTIELDGKPFPSGLWGIATPMEAGTHQIDAHAPGKSAFSTSVVLKEKDASKVAIKLGDAPTNQPPETKPAPTTPMQPTTTPTVVAPSPATPPEAEHPRSRAAAVVTGLGAVVLAGFGVAAFLVADGQANDAQAFCATQATATCNANQSQIRVWDTVALTSWITAGALAVTSVVLWVLPSHKAATSARIELRPLGAALGGTFQ